MSENREFHCKQYIVVAGFRPPGGALPEEPGARIVAFDDKGAVLMCNRIEPHEHEWPDDYSPVNPRSR